MQYLDVDEWTYDSWPFNKCIEGPKAHISDKFSGIEASSVRTKSCNELILILAIFWGILGYFGLEGGEVRKGIFQIILSVIVFFK